MARKPITFRGFDKGFILKGDCFGNPGIFRSNGFKFGNRLGCLESRGGVDSWNTAATDWTYINGIKKWYREDGGSNIFVLGTQDGGARRLWYFNPESKSVTSLVDLSAIICDDNSPVAFVNCNSQMLVLPYMSTGRPYSIKLLQQGAAGGITARALGLDAPATAPSISAIGASTAGTNQQPRDQIRDGSYIYRYTYSYGTKEEPNKYGESALSPILVADYPASTAGYVGGGDYNGIIQIQGWTALTSNGIVRRINIYRSKRNETTVYKIGEILEPGLLNWNDTIGDSFIDLSKTAPTYTGIPTAMRCAIWHPTFQRLFWFGMDGYFHWSAAGYADINPSTQRMEVGSRGYYGNAIALIRNAIYCFKEDGVFLIQGEAPNYFSTKVSNVQCFSRTSVAELPDGIYFLGVDSGKIKIFRFNGNTAEAISEDITSIIPSNKASVFQRAFGCRVGDEYWLSLMFSDPRYCYYPVPFNNGIVMYDYRLQSWAGNLNVQASSIDVWDGPGDSGEVFITESDPDSDANKGNIFRLEKRSGENNTTDYWTTSRNYNIGNSQRVINLGVIPGINPDDNSLEKVYPYICKARVRGYLGKSPVAYILEDDSQLDKFVVGPISPEPSILRYNELTITGVTACVVGVGTVGHSVIVNDIVEDFEFDLKDIKHRTGLNLELHFDTEGKFVEVEGVEFGVDFSNQA